MAMKLISTNTASSDTTLDITSDIGSTYKLYMFKYYDVNPETDDVNFTFQVNAAGQSGFNETTTTTYYYMHHSEADTTATWSMNASNDQVSGTGYQIIADGVGNGGDESAAGTLYLFNPSNTTYMKHWWSRCSEYGEDNFAKNVWVDGYFAPTAAIDEVSFKMSSGDFDGIVKMYGVA